MVNHNGFNVDEVAADFGIRIKEELTLVDARVLPPPRVVPILYFLFISLDALCHIYRQFLFNKLPIVSDHPA